MEEEDGWVNSEEDVIEAIGTPEVIDWRAVKRVGGSTWMPWTAAKAASSFSRRGKNNMTDKLGKLLDMGHSTVVDGSSWHQFTQKFVVENDCDIVNDKIEIALDRNKNSKQSLIERVKAPLDKARAVMPWGDNHVIVFGERDGHNVLIQVVITNAGRRTKTSPGVSDIIVDIVAHPDACEIVKKEIEEALEFEEMAQVKWWTQGAHGPDALNIYLPPNKTLLRPEFYPDIPDPNKYLSDYMQAEESVLLMAGPPGTGKTTLLRHLIADRKLTAHVIYDEILMQKDSVFQSFLFDDDSDVLIIEDADTILSDRERDGNKLMSRFLNVSDGLIKLPNKKLVFTTNLTDFSRVDQALLRPGRCFGVLNTRLLTLSEAQEAAKVASLPIPIEKREYTIAELFNQGKGAKARSVGFGVRH